MLQSCIGTGRWDEGEPGGVQPPGCGIACPSRGGCRAGGHRVPSGAGQGPCGGGSAAGGCSQALKPVPVSGPTDRRTDGRPPSWGTPRLPSRHPPMWAAATPTRSCPTPTPRAAPSAPNCSRPPSPRSPATPCGSCPARTRVAPRPRPAWMSRWVLAPTRPLALALLPEPAGKVRVPPVAAPRRWLLRVPVAVNPMPELGFCRPPRCGEAAWEPAAGKWCPGARPDGGVERGATRRRDAVPAAGAVRRPLRPPPRVLTPSVRCERGQAKAVAGTAELPAPTSRVARGGRAGRPSRRVFHGLVSLPLGRAALGATHLPALVRPPDGVRGPS